MSAKNILSFAAATALMTTPVSGQKMFDTKQEFFVGECVLRNPTFFDKDVKTMTGTDFRNGRVRRGIVVEVFLPPPDSKQSIMYEIKFSDSAHEVVERVAKSSYTRKIADSDNEAAEQPTTYFQWFLKSCKTQDL